jgi:hypothetical protein
MQRSLLLGTGFLVAATLGYFLGAATGDRANAEPDLSLYFADVVLVDAETGKPVSPQVHFPTGFFPTYHVRESGSEKISGTGYGPVRSELDHSTGRCRITWIGMPGVKVPFRLSAEGYETLELPPERIEEVAHQESIGGIVEPTTISIRRAAPVANDKQSDDKQS